VSTSTNDDACPYCGETTGVQPMPAPPKVQAWMCTACGTDWAISVVNPQPYLDHLTATVEQLAAARSILREVVALAADAPQLADVEIRDRLLTLAFGAR
jgi:ribosomal protein L37AE/L43A